jgi:hypothetical protein
MKPATILVAARCALHCPRLRIFAFDADARGIYQAALDLRFGEAEAGLQSMRQQSPDNLVVPLLENYLEVLRILADDDEAAYRRLSPGMDKKLWKISREIRSSLVSLHAGRNQAAVGSAEGAFRRLSVGLHRK